MRLARASECQDVCPCGDPLANTNGSRLNHSRVARSRGKAADGARKYGVPTPGNGRTSSCIQETDKSRSLIRFPSIPLLRAQKKNWRKHRRKTARKRVVTTVLLRSTGLRNPAIHQNGPCVNTRSLTYLTGVHTFGGDCCGGKAAGKLD
jgi:hypothetical protein